MAPDVDVVIVGGGVIGLATAYYLGKRGVASLIVEADGVASGASGAAAGLLSQPTLEERRSAIGPLMQASFAEHLKLAKELPLESGVDYEFARGGMLQVAQSESEEAEAHQRVDDEVAAGMATRWLSEGEARELCDWIDLPIRGAVQPPGNAHLDAYLFSLALLGAAEGMGASLRTGRVTGVARAGERLTAVRVGEEVIPCSASLFAMGPWTGAAGPWLGTPIPIEPLKGQIVRVRPSRPAPRYGFGDHGHNYASPKASGLVYLGTTEEAVGFAVAPTVAARDQILAFALRASTSLGDAEVVEQTACLRPLSADGLPLISPVPGLAGAFVGTGHGRKGIMLGPATGQLLAQLILDEPPSLDLAPFDVQRFAG